MKKNRSYAGPDERRLGGGLEMKIRRRLEQDALAFAI
jgi:hypothetical protein